MTLLFNSCVNHIQLLYNQGKAVWGINLVFKAQLLCRLFYRSSQETNSSTSPCDKHAQVRAAGCTYVACACQDSLENMKKHTNRRGRAGFMLSWLLSDNRATVEMAKVFPVGQENGSACHNSNSSGKLMKDLERSKNKRVKCRVCKLSLLKASKLRLPHTNSPHPIPEKFFLNVSLHGFS